MKREIMVMDGATGTALWQLAEARSIEKLPVWQYNLTHPELVTEVSRRYAAAGSQILLTNSFAANRQSLSRYPDFDLSAVLTRSVELARLAAEGSSARVAFDVGPLLQMMEPWGDMTRDEARALFREVLQAGASCHPDYLFLETFIDLDMMQIAAEEAVLTGLPVLASMSFEKVGKTIMGNSVEAFIEAMEAIGIAGLGLNCSMGPDLAEPIMRQFRGKTRLKLLFKPNAGKTHLSADGSVVSEYTAESFVSEIAPALDYVDFVGGCCGTDPRYIQLLCDKLNLL